MSETAETLPIIEAMPRRIHSMGAGPLFPLNDGSLIEKLVAIEAKLDELLGLLRPYEGAIQFGPEIQAAFDRLPGGRAPDSPERERQPVRVSTIDATTYPAFISAFQAAWNAACIGIVPKTTQE